MKKIIFFSGDINRSGGTERVSTIIANELIKHNYKIIFLSLEHGLNPFFKIDDQIDLFSLKMENKNKLVSYFSIIKKLRKFLKQQQFDYIIDIDVILSIFSIPAASKAKTSVISWEHFNYFADVGNKFQNIKRNIARHLAARKAKYIITLTEKDKAYYNDNTTGKAKIITIHNPLTIKKTKQSNLKNKIVLAVGRLTYQKGFDILLETWKIANNKLNDWNLKIIGSGEDEMKLKKKAIDLGIDKNVIFTPTTNQIEKQYIDASIYVLSSRYEGFGLVLTEAKACGLPLVGFDCDCGPSDIIKDNIDGFLVKNGDYKELANKLIKLMNDYDLRIKMGTIGFNDNRFELNTIINNWKNILK